MLGLAGSVGIGGVSASKIALTSTLPSGMVNLLLVITSPAGDSTCHFLKRYSSLGIAVRVISVPAAAVEGVAVPMPFPSLVTVTMYSVGAGGASSHSALTVMSAVTVTGAFTGYSVPSISHALNCFPSGAINSHSGREYSLPCNTFLAGIAVGTSSGSSSGSEPPPASKVTVCSLRFSNAAVMVTSPSGWTKV